jgi:hypothetical protein
MTSTIEVLASALDSLSTAIRSGPIGENTFSTHWGWNNAAIDKEDLASVASRLARDIRYHEPSENINKLIDKYIVQLARLQADTVPNLYNGHSNQSVPAIMCTILAMRDRLAPYFGGFNGIDPTLDATKIARKYTKIQAKLEEFEPSIERLESSVSAITIGAENAHKILELLKEVDGIRTETAQSKGDIISRKNDVATILSDAVVQKEELSSILEIIQSKADILIADTNKQVNAIESVVNKKIEATDGEIQKGIEKLRNENVQLKSEIEKNLISSRKLIEQAHNALQEATTTGLAGSFQTRASRLRLTMVFWVVLLIVSLYTCLDYGSTRAAALTERLNANSLTIEHIWVNLLLSVMMLGGPIWLAWISSKQIGYLFRLSEDYQYKAALAKAYEGYRKEAATIDKEFVKHIFKSAMQTLDQAPLRHIETNVHGSPWTELFTRFIAKKANQENQMQPPAASKSQD